MGDWRRREILENHSTWEHHDDISAILDLFKEGSQKDQPSGGLFK